ncbi:leucine-rich repeat extensin-like protein 1 [Camellia sinensis]|uniref:leucine-rich repeat extensin-like protein 1 n=1 Tax=Camellia sinensis TaxID=4442 RepID=UPI001036F29B|nr:leucine-rich repeat extensin-like protein 1 [Camellia sinensis]
MVSIAHRSVQILRDKQELAETQKELAKLKLAQKESSSVSHSQQNEDRATPPASDPKRTDNTPDMQLALALPHQVAPQPPLPTRPVEQQQPMPPPPPQSVSQSQAYYLPSAQIQNPPGPAQLSQTQYLPSDSPYRTPQMQDMSRVAPQPAQTQVNQAPQVHQLPQYQQQWAQQVTPPPQSSMQQPQIRPMSTTYPPYLPSQPANPSPPETLPNSMPMQVSYLGSHVEPMPYGYGGPGRTVQQQQQQPPPQQLKSSFGVQPNDGYTTSGPHPTLSPGNAYMMYEGEAGRAHPPPPSQQPPHFPQGSGYPPTSVPLQGPQPNAGPNLMGRPPQFMRNHPYNELIDKLVSMGYRGDHVASMHRVCHLTGGKISSCALPTHTKNK